MNYDILIYDDAVNRDIFGISIKFPSLYLNYRSVR